MFFRLLLMVHRWVGVALCVTSLTLAWRVLGRKLRGFDGLTAERDSVIGY
jgi:hypothetical protein